MKVGKPKRVHRVEPLTPPVPAKRPEKPRPVPDRAPAKAGSS